MKLKKLSEETDVRIKSKDEYLVLMDLAEKAGYKWTSGDRPTFFNNDTLYTRSKKIRLRTDKTIARLLVVKNNVSLNEIIEFEQGDKVRVKKFDKRPRNWNDKGKMDHLMGEVVEIDSATLFSLGGITVWDEKENRTWALKKGEYEVVKETSPNIVISRDGQKVIAIDKKNDKKAIAKCHPDDEFNFETGVRIAIDRLFEKKEEKEEEYKVGDFVKIKTWEQMEKEYGLDRDGDINVKSCFYVKTMKKYCGKVFVIARVVAKNEVFELNDCKGTALSLPWQFPKESFECKVKAEEATFEDGYTYVFNKEKVERYNDKFQSQPLWEWTLECNGRAVKKVSKKMGRIGEYAISPKWCDKYKEVKRQAKVGEYVKIVIDYDAVSSGGYENGDILEVVRDLSPAKMVIALKRGVNYLIHNDEYVVLDGYKQKEKEQLYNGKIIFTKGDEYFKTGHIYEIKDGRIKVPISCHLIPYSEDGLFKNIDDVKDFFTDAEKRKRSKGWSNETLELIEVLDD